MATCVPLWDGDGLLAELARSVTPYPERLRDALLANMWQADFVLDGAQKGAASNDAGYVALCASTALMVVAHGWHAAAGRWVTNEKGLIPGVATLPLETDGFSSSAASELGALGSTADELMAVIARLRDLPRPASTV